MTEQVGTRLLGLSRDRFAYPSRIARAIASVVSAVEDDAESPLTWRNAIEATEVIFAAWESARRRARIDLPLDITGNPLEAMVEAGELPVAAEPASEAVSTDSTDLEADAAGPTE